MNPSNREKEIFEQALDLPSPAARRDYVQGACGGDADLLARVETLLRAHDATGNFLPENPAADATIHHAMAEVAEKPGSVIGRYKLLQELGEGGCGIVYMAEQEVPVRRRVALKVIKLGMDTKAVIARFEAERQALAMMDHPNIAKVLDAGATDTGRPYFVMELVRGLPITTYCDQHNLPMLDRLNLFTQVCHAIQHAHQKGIIHRDIKPSNILVTLHDGVPVPKVIDFGIAKATLGRLTDQTVFTAFEQFIGTPAYMSPEQAEMSGLDIDTRSDIYSLGVLLYELLTGKPPFDPQTLLKAGLDEIRRLIREIEPPKPSTRLSTLTAADSTTLAKLRGTDPAKLSVLVRGDLDWIVMKALEKNRTRRYETAGAFAADIQRHLHNEPVTARPPSAGYLLQKLISRNRLVFAATTAIAAALVLGLGVATWAFVQEKAARQRAVAAEHEQAEQRQLAELACERAVAAEKEQSKARVSAEAARASAEEARTNEAKHRALAEAEEKKAKIAAAKSEQAFKFMARMLAGVGPSVAVGRDTTLLREILDKTVKRLDRDMQDQPEVDASLRGTLAGVYDDLGDYAKAEALARDALAKAEKLFGPEHEEVAGGKLRLAQIRLTQGHGTESERLIREALAILRKLPGDWHENLAETLIGLSSALNGQGRLVEAEAPSREAITLLKQHPESEFVTQDYAMLVLANLLQRQGRQAEAEPLVREALAVQRARLSPDDPLVGTSLVVLANVLRQQGKMPEAESTLREAIAIMKKSFGAEHPIIAMYLPNLAVILQMQGRFPEAEALCREALALATKTLGPDHPTIAFARDILVQTLQQQGKTAAAEAMQKEAVTAVKPDKAPVSEGVMAALKKTEVAWAAMQKQKFAEAETNLREALLVLETTLGNSNQNVIGTRRMLFDALQQQGKFAEAEAVARDQLLLVRKAYGDKSTVVADTLFLLATSTQLQGKLVEAETALNEALAINKLQTTDGENADVAMVLLQLATVKATQGATESEIGLLCTQAIEITRKLPASTAPTVTNRCDLMFNLLMKYDKPAQAEPIERVLVAATRQFLGNENEPLAHKLMGFNWVLWRNGKHAEAGAVAREAMEIQKKIQPRDDWRIYAAEFKVGLSLYELKQYAEAETILLEAFSGLSKHGPGDTNPQYGSVKDFIGYTAGTLAQVYEATQQPAKHAEWKKKYDDHTAAAKVAETKQ